MILEKRIWLFVLFLGILLESTSGTMQDGPDVAHEFSHTDSSYSFTGSFYFKGDPDCILDISFQFEHIQNLALDAKEILLVQQGENWNQVSYTYQKFHFFRNKTHWYRLLDKQRKRVDFRLLSSENNLSSMPQLRSSSGYYQVRQEGSHYLLEYFQECEIGPSNLTNIYLNRAEKEAIRFITYFSKYARENCSEILSIGS